MIKLVASDLDGTILKNGAQVLPDGFIDLIRKLMQAGIHFAAASGRQYANMRRLFEPLGDEISYICENGALTFYKGELLNQDLFPDDLLRDILREAQAKEGCEATSSMWDVQYLLSDNPEFIRMLTEVIRYDCKVVSSVEEIPRGCIKAAVYEYCGDMEENLAYWKERFGSRCKVATSGSRWLDFIPFQTNKGNGVRELLRKLELKPEECMVFGDEYNDIEMLQNVTYSVAMSYAKEGVRQAAAFQADSVEEIFEKLIQTGGETGGLF